MKGSCFVRQTLETPSSAFKSTLPKYGLNAQLASCRGGVDARLQNVRHRRHLYSLVVGVKVEDMKLVWPYPYDWAVFLMKLW